MNENLFLFVTVVVLAVAVYTDSRWHKVFNWLTFPSAGAAVVLSAFAGTDRLAQSLQGLGAGVAIGLVLMVMARVGAGDAKLLMAVGALMGPNFLLWTALWGAVAGGPLALYYMWRRGVMRHTLTNMAANTMAKAMGSVETTITDNSKAGKFPYALAIAVGAVIAYFTRGA